MDEGAADRARQPGAEPFGNDGEAGNPDASLVDELLEVAVRSAGRARPLGAVVREGVLLSHRLEGEIEPLGKEGPVVRQPAHIFAGGAVVGEENDQRVLEPAPVAERPDQPSDMMVETLDHGRVDLHLARFDPSLLAAEIRPSAGVRRERRNGGVGGNDPGALRSLDPPAGQLFPARVVVPGVEVEELLGNLQRPVRSGVGGEGEERSVLGAGLRDVFDQPVGIGPGRIETFREGVHDLAVLPVADFVEGVHRRGILEMARRPLEQHEGAFEAAGPRAVFVRRSEVPFPGDRGVVAGVQQHARQVEHMVVQVPLVADPPFEIVPHQARHAAQPRKMVVHSGKQHGAGRRAGGRGVKAREAQPGGGQCVEIRGSDLPAEGAEIGVSEIVGDDDQDVRRRRRPGAGAAAAGKQQQGSDQQKKGAAHPPIMECRRARRRGRPPA